MNRFVFRDSFQPSTVRGLLAALLVGLVLSSAAGVWGQGAPVKDEPAATQPPTPAKEPTSTPQPGATQPAATEQYTLPDDPTIPKKFDSPAALEKWLNEIEKLYVPPKWSEKPKLSDEERDKLEIQRESALKKARAAKNADEFQTRIAVVLQRDSRNITKCSSWIRVE